MFSEERKKELLFPHEEVRKSQENLIVDVEKTILEGKRLVANAPTGLGKTASVLGPALSYALKKDLTVWFLTNRHTQHQLAVETLKLIQKKFQIDFNCVDLIGKRWMCNQEVKGLFSNEFHEFCKALTEKGECEFLNKVKEKNKLTVEAKKLIEELTLKGVMHNEEVIERCKQEGLCSYEVSLELAKKAKVVIGDYYYLFNPFIQQTIFNKMGKEMEKTVLVVDEAHNLPKRAVEMLSYRLTDGMLKNAVFEAKKTSNEKVIPLLIGINRVLFELRDSVGGGERLVGKKEFMDKITGVKNYDELAGELEFVGDEIRKSNKRSYIGGVASFLGAWKGEDEGFTRIMGEKESYYGLTIYLSYDCLDPALATRGVFGGVQSAVLMSGTLQPTFMYNDILGASGVEKDYPNPFPIENKLTLIVPETTTKYSSRGEGMYKQIGEKCSKMLENMKGNCAVFFPSYKIRDLVGVEIFTEKKKFFEKSEMSKEEKEEFLERFKAEKDAGGVLLGVMGGSFGEGVDLPGDLLNGVIIVGVPLSKPDLKTKETVKYFEKKFGKGWEYGYLYPAMNKCFQSAGRCIRSAEDKGAVVFLDERFTWPTYFCCFSKEGLIVTKEFERYLKGFFGESFKYR